MPSGVYKRTKKTKEILRLAHLGKSRGGNPENWKHTEATKEKCRQANLGKNIGNQFAKGNKPNSTSFKKGHIMNRREKNPMWKGGISLFPYSIDWTEDLKESIRKRDNYVCQECGLHQDELKGRNKKLDVHHIDYDKDNLNPENLITLCKSCHTKTTFDREYWTNYFKEK